jgi:peptide/nickel transport system ATP-binding protein
MNVQAPSRLRPVADEPNGENNRQELLRLENLSVAFNGVPAVHAVNLSISKGEALGLVGESGSGKSVTWLATLGLLTGHVAVSGQALLNGEDLLALPERRMARIRGGQVAMIFQDPASALNPLMTIRRQMAEVLALHQGLSGRAIDAEAAHLLDLVGIPDAKGRLSAYPHEFSGGQSQRVMIAMGLAGKPDLLVADEPTTALDVTIQAQILDLLTLIRVETGMAMVLISHDLGVVAQNCARVAVMYAGHIVEVAPTADIFDDPAHPYTAALISALPRVDGPRHRLTEIAGTLPDPKSPEPGCAFAPRCAQVRVSCTAQKPTLVAVGKARRSACPVIAADCNLGGGHP